MIRIPSDEEDKGSRKQLNIQTIKIDKKIRLTPQRRAFYRKFSKSTNMKNIFQNKLLYYAEYDPVIVKNDYIINEAKKYLKPLVNLCMEYYGKTG